jgi:gluconate 2-dehydrogenase alpha chain
VVKVNLDQAKKRATGVTYLDARGRETEQPADLVILCTFPLNNVHLLLVSGIGAPYEPESGNGAVGRNYSYSVVSRIGLFFEDQITNPFMGAGALAMCVDDLNGDNFDHAPLGFQGGAQIQCATTGGHPIRHHPVPDGTPRWGSDWKKAVAKYYARSCAIDVIGGTMAYRGNYLDLDPIYKDAFGRPLLRMTYDHQDNDQRMSRYVTNAGVQIAKAMGASHMTVSPAQVPYSIVSYQTTDNAGGAVMGTDPRTSVVNRFLQSWDVSNLFVLGASAFPQNTSRNPTNTAGALAYWAADAIKSRYLKSPGPLMQG